MKRMLFIENAVDEKSSKLGHAIDVAKNRGLELSAVFVISVRLDVADWVEVQEKNVKEAETKVTNFAKKIEAELKDKGPPFRWNVVRSVSDPLIQALEAFTPTDIIVAGNIDLEPLREKGIKNLEDLSSHLRSPIVPLDRLWAGETKAKRPNLFRFLAFACISAASYFIFFPQIDRLNHAIFMKGTILGGIAVMVVVGIHAYCYGSFTEYFPKFFGLDKPSEH